MPAERARPPAWTLLLGLGLALLTVLGLGAVGGAHQDPIQYFNVGRLSESARPAVAVIGTSLVRHALPLDEALGMPPGVSPYRFVRFTKAGGTPPDFSVLLPRLLVPSVKMVFLQAEPFLLHFHECSRLSAGVANTLAAPVRRAFDQFGMAVWRLRGRPVATTENFDDADLKLEGIRGQQDADKKVRLCGDAGILPEQYEQFIEQATARGIRVVLLSMGRSPEANAKLGGEFQREYDKALQALAARYRIELWSFPAQSGDHFRDRAHLNTQGREAFTRWFLGRLPGNGGNER